MGIVIWLTGLENYQIDNKSLVSLIDRHDEAFSHFISKEEGKVPNHYFLNLFYEYLLEKHQDAEIKAERKVIDIIINGQKIRFITDNLTAVETDLHIINAPSDVNIVIAARPKNINKGEIEDKLTIKHRLSVNISAPKSSNLIKLLSLRSWTWNCFLQKFSEALFGILTGTVASTISSIIIKLFFQ